MKKRWCEGAKSGSGHWADSDNFEIKNALAVWELRCQPCAAWSPMVSIKEENPNP
jgi:hypothetical protein